MQIPLKLRAIKLEQNGKEFYLFKIKAKELLSISYFNSRESDRKNGIQRTLQQERAKAISEYLESENSVLANSLLVNFKESNVSFNEDTQEIEIQKDKDVAFIIDGQHRLKAFDYHKDDDFEIPISGFIGLSLAEAAEFFVRINYFQKPVNKSLVYDLLGISEKIFPEYVQAHEITKILNENPGSPWFGLIKMLGIGNGIITQATFITALEENKILNYHLKEYEFDDKVIILSNYFQAVKKVFPDAWGDKTSIISKSVGFNAFVRIFPKVFIEVINKKKSFIIDDIVKFLEGLKAIDFTSKEISNLGGKKGVGTLASQMENLLIKQGNLK